jgi:hypothetical protein
VTSAWTVKNGQGFPTSETLDLEIKNLRIQSYAGNGESLTLTSKDFLSENPNVWAVLFASSITRDASKRAYYQYQRAMTGLNVMEAVADSFENKR